MAVWIKGAGCVTKRHDRAHVRFKNGFEKWTFSCRIRIVYPICRLDLGSSTTIRLNQADVTGSNVNYSP